MSWIKQSAPKTPAKKFKTDNDEDEGFDDFFAEISQNRIFCASSIKEFKFNKKRVMVLSEVTEIPKRSDLVVYWMSRDQRVQDNWALLYAQYLALKVDLPLCVCFCIVPKFLDATIRHYRFMLKGLQEVSKECELLNIHFHLLFGEAKVALIDFVKRHKVGGVVTDFAPLKVPLKWVSDVKEKLPSNVPIVQPVDWHEVEKKLEVNMDVAEVDWAVPGTNAGFRKLSDFCQNRLKHFDDLRNNPTKDALSNLSPWFHFGHISIQRTILTVLKFKAKFPKSVDAFIEEAVIRRELADNFCYYNPKYDQVDGAYDWAKKTLKDHAKDKREYLYTCDELENSKTHDLLWNAAQLQMVREGKMHGFLRMYWAKKILEWTPTPEKALEIAIYLNDKYELDGRDPNGYVGCMWSICGIHDQGWKERPVFGKIRFMNFKGCQRKFDVDEFIQRYK